MSNNTFYRIEGSRDEIGFSFTDHESILKEIDELIENQNKIEFVDQNHRDIWGSYLIDTYNDTLDSTLSKERAEKKGFNTDNIYSCPGYDENLGFNVLTKDENIDTGYFVRTHNSMIVDKKYLSGMGIPSIEEMGISNYEFWNNYKDLIIEDLSPENDSIVLESSKESTVISLNPKMVKSSESYFSDFFRDTNLALDYLDPENKCISKKMKLLAILAKKRGISKEDIANIASKQISENNLDELLKQSEEIPNAQFSYLPKPSRKPHYKIINKQEERRYLTLELVKKDLSEQKLKIFQKFEVNANNPLHIHIDKKKSACPSNVLHHIYINKLNEDKSGDKKNNEGQNLNSRKNEKITNTDINNALKDKGYDSVLISYSDDKRRDLFVFDPNLIKKSDNYEYVLVEKTDIVDIPEMKPTF